MKEPIGSEEIFLLPEGDRIPFAGLLNDLDTARVIFIGESHDQIEHHQIQVRMLQGLLEKGKEITRLKDIHDAVSQRGWGRNINMIILRKGVREEMTVKLPPAEE